VTQSGGPHGSEAATWNHIASHLTVAHGTDPRAIESYAPTLGQLECEHWTAYLTDDATGLIFQHSHHPHSHPDPLPEGQPYRTADSFAPFPPSPTLQAGDHWALAGRDTAPHLPGGDPEVWDGPEVGG
jgi:hypothetical protein